MQQTKTNRAFEQKLELHKREIEALKAQLAAARAEAQDAKLRLSKMASARMREGNACVEDMNDPRRPTALASKWAALYRCGDYWTAFQALAEIRGETAPPFLLQEISKVVYEGCKKHVQQVSNIVVRCANAAGTQATKQFKYQLKKDMQLYLEPACSASSERPGDQGGCCQALLSGLEAMVQAAVEGQIAPLREELHRRLMALLRSLSPPRTAIEEILASLRKNPDIDVDEENYRKFAEELAQLCYYMQTQDIPLVVDFSCSVGSTFCPDLFEAESDCQAAAASEQGQQPPTIRCILRPPLLRSQEGAVLCKGEVELDLPKPACLSSSLAQDGAGDEGRKEEEAEAAGEVKSVAAVLDRDRQRPDTEGPCPLPTAPPTAAAAAAAAAVPAAAAAAGDTDKATSGGSGGPSVGGTRSTTAAPRGADLQHEDGPQPINTQGLPSHDAPSAPHSAPPPPQTRTCPSEHAGALQKDQSERGEDTGTTPTNTINERAPLPKDNSFLFKIITSISVSIGHLVQASS